MKTQHTPGPWLIRSDDALRQTLIWSDARTDVARIQWDGFTENNETEANARLIAAAPELAEALREMLEVSACRSLSNCGGRGAVEAPAMLPAYGKRQETPCDCCVCEAARTARAVLAKIEGREG